MVVVAVERAAGGRLVHVEVVKGCALRHSKQKVGKTDTDEHHFVNRTQQIRVGQQAIFEAIVQKLVVLFQHFVDVGHFLCLVGQKGKYEDGEYGKRANMRMGLKKG